jgi:hypothetical protein
MAYEPAAGLITPHRHKMAVILNLVQDPLLLRTAAACGSVDAGTSSA